MNQAEADLGIPSLLLTGHDVKCTPGVFDEATYRRAMHGLRQSGPSRSAATGTGRLPVALRTGPPYPVRRPSGPGTTPGPPSTQPDSRRNP